MPSIKNTSNLVAANDQISMRLPAEKACSISIQTGAANAVNADVKFYARLRGATTWIGPFLFILPDGSTGTTLTGVDKFGTVPVNLQSAAEVAARRTDANGGVCTVFLAVTELAG